MIQFVPKTEEQLQWDLVKAAVRAKVALEVANYRNRRINEMLAELWPMFQAALSGEEVLGIDPMFEEWVRDAVMALPTAEYAAD